MTTKQFQDKLALVTGASRGIGRAVAKALAREGAHVIITGRRVGSLETLDDEIRAEGGASTLVKLDLAQGDKIDALGPTIYQRWGKLDILIANAGILGPLSPLPHISMEDWQGVLDINLNANIRLIRTCDPLLRAAEAGRGIFATSGAADARNAYWGPYAVSKAALEALVKTYARELDNTAVRVNLLNPGPTATGMRAQAFPGEDPDTLPTPEDLAPLFIELAAPDLEANGQRFNFQTPKR